MRALKTLGGVGGGIPERYGGGWIWGERPAGGAGAVLAQKGELL